MWVCNMPYAIKSDSTADGCVMFIGMHCREKHAPVHTNHLKWLEKK
jgi:hypothetical protein